MAPYGLKRVKPRHSRRAKNSFEATSRAGEVKMARAWPASTRWGQFQAAGQGSASALQADSN